jgi:hypothetical protein
LEANPMGTRDDHHDTDECLRLRNRRIFVIDSPGWNLVLPAPDGTTFGGFSAGVATHADATDVVIRFSFAEWVIARNRSEGIPWTRISGLVLWHSITWLTRDATNQWVLDNRSEIDRRSLSARVINSPPA